jgi:hypothetical protein
MKTPALLFSRSLLAAASIGAMASCSSSISGDRPLAPDGRAVHGPRELDEFVLEAPVELHGLGTRAALEKLDRAYRESCRKAGEVPLELRYEVPAGYEQPLNFATAPNFDQAVREIAACSKLEVSRRGASYRFRPFQVPGKVDQPVETTHRVPPDFLSQVSRDAYDQRLPIRAAIEKRGVSLDESTRLTLRTGDSTLGVETRDRSDDAAISAMIQAMLRGTPRQIRWETRTFEIPSGQSWDGPAEGVVEGEVMAELRRIPGVREQILTGGSPLSSPLRSNQPRLDPLPEGTLRSQAGLLAFGIQVRAELQQESRGNPPVSIGVAGQTPDGGTRIATAKRPDGSRVVLAVSPTVIDATGRPVKK